MKCWHCDTELTELFEEPEMWEHYCHEEHSMMAVGKGEPCNWCGKEEEDCESCS